VTETARELQSAPPYGPSVVAAISGKTVVLDCRWVGLGGAGRVTELLLSAFRQAPPPGTWILWGRSDRVADHMFEGAAIQAWHGDPRALAGQRDAFRVPPGDVVVYLHQIRPFGRRPSVTVIHDTIPVRYGGRAVSRLAKHAYLLLAARASRHVLTDSEFSKTCIARDLRVPLSRITVMRFPADVARAAAIARLRDELGQTDRALYVGRFARHKNLERLCRAFAGTRFAQSGGTLVLVGGWAQETEAMNDWLGRSGIRGVETRPECSEAELNRLLATSRALVVPSLEEGYGLPAFEAVACGLPVAATPTGAMPELPPDRVVLFNPLDQAEMGRALDAVTRMPPQAPWTDGRSDLAGVVLRAIAGSVAQVRSR
jgi:glycosyltransferase involved in cell wall biosynthesis